MWFLYWGSDISSLPVWVPYLITACSCPDNVAAVSEQLSETLSRRIVQVAQPIRSIGPELHKENIEVYEWRTIEAAASRPAVKWASKRAAKQAQKSNSASNFGNKRPSSRDPLVEAH